MQQVTASERWASFVSLQWYDGLISFLFRFVAKTSEPLLAAGVIVSAADFLQKGALMAHNPTLSTAWAWTQALAIEASTGPVLVFALQAFRARDMVKGWLYAILAALLFIVGGSMLLLQLISSVTGISEASINIIVLYALFVLRVIVSGGMVALSCTKHLRFSGLFAGEQGANTQPVSLEAPAPVSAPTITLTPELVDALRALLAQQTVIQPAEEEQKQITGPGAKISEQGANTTSQAEALGEGEHEEDQGEQGTNNGEWVKAYLVLHPDAKVREVAEALEISTSTANKWISRVRETRTSSKESERVA